jgi:hypothetical protein
VAGEANAQPQLSHPTTISRSGTYPLLPFLAGCPHQFQSDTLSLQSVVIVGLGASGIDIASEISHVAKELHIAARYSEDRLGKIELFNNAWMHGEVQLCFIIILEVNSSYGSLC